MTRPRHAMRPHPLRSPGVVVGVPVAAAVAFGAHAVLGVIPLAHDQGAPAPSSASPTAAPTAGAPVQGYGLATAPPPTTLGLLSAPGTDHPATSGSGGSTVPIAGSSTHHAGPTRTVPIAGAAPAAAPSMMTFSASHPAPAATAPAAAAPAVAAPQAAAPPAEAAPAPAPPAQRAAAPAAAPADHDGGSSDQGSSGGALLGVDLGAAKVSVLSFGD